MARIEGLWNTILKNWARRRSWSDNVVWRGTLPDHWRAAVRWREDRDFRRTNCFRKQGSGGGLLLSDLNRQRRRLDHRFQNRNPFLNFGCVCEDLRAKKLDGESTNYECADIENDSHLPIEDIVRRQCPTKILSVQ